MAKRGEQRRRGRKAPRSLGGRGRNRTRGKSRPSETRRPRPQAASGGNGSDTPQPLYEVRRDGIWWNKRDRNGTLTPAKLSNFQATIAVEITEDDGAQTRKLFEIRAGVPGTEPRTVTIPAEDFAGMRWVVPQLGAWAVISSGHSIADRLREAIQHFSGDMERRTIYTHTGWRKIDGKWFYLHTGGAIGAEGNRQDVTVRLPGELQRLQLPDPPTDDALREAVRASLALLDVAPRTVTVPLLAATYLSALCEGFGSAKPNLTIWLSGETGQRKTALASLAQSHFGDFPPSALPCSFEATPNAVELVQFTLKDALCVIDDFRPTTSRSQREAMEKVADRVVRTAGNTTGRARLQADMKLRPEYRPRGVPLITAELSTPSGVSTGARAFLVHVPTDGVDLAKLTEVQQRSNLLPVAMAAFICWVAKHAEPWRLGTRHPVARREVAKYVKGHGRLPEQVAYLFQACGALGAFAHQIGIFTEEELQRFLADAYAALTNTRADQAAQLVEESPVARFLALLREGFATRRIYVEACGGGPPENATAWGWELATDHNGNEQWRHPPSAVLIGWLDGDHVLLLPEETKTFIHRASQTRGETFPVDWVTLLRHLDEAGHIETQREKNKNGHEVTRRVVVAWAGGKSQRVVKLPRTALDASLGPLLQCPKCQAKVPPPAFNGAPYLIAPCPRCKAEVGWPRDQAPSAS